mgnify:CR=1 FL=1
MIDFDDVLNDNCEVCGKLVKNYKPKICCNVFDCPCEGKPLYPPICSSECWKVLTELKIKRDQNRMEEIEKVLGGFLLKDVIEKIKKKG